MAQSNAKTEVALEIVSLSHGPYGIGRHEGRVVMVPGTVPGDRVTASITASKPGYDTGYLSHINTASAQRRQPPCPYVGACGGCPWQQMDYEAQLAAKARNLDDALRRIGKLNDFTLLPIVSAPREFSYRRRIQLRCGPDKRVGFSPSASHDLVAIERCAIATDAVNRALEQVRLGIPRTLANIGQVEIVEGDRGNETAVVVHADAPLVACDAQIFEKLVNSGHVKGIIVKAHGQRQIWGDPRLSVIAEPGLDHLVDADVFTQINAEGNRLLLQRLLGFVGCTPRERVLELYCGAGNFTLSMARRCGEVLAVEGDPHAIANGKLNAQRHGIENIRWRAAPVPAAVAALARRKESFAKVVLDPPRAGAKGIDQHLAALGAERLIYISCNPPTLARDLAALTRRGYRLVEVQPLDLFPQTFHVEALALLKRQ
jgi:23S rRNA (uracil1939-C5)-methyltransferase